MNIFLKSIKLMLVLFSAIQLSAQVAWLTPSDPSETDTITLTFNTNGGNKGLADWHGDVYLHTGLITKKSIDGGDWKHVIGNWGKADPRVIMIPKGDSLYTFTFVIKDYYGLREDESVNQLAFVFRNADGSKVGKTKNNDDILLPVNGYKPPVKEPPKYLFKDREYLSHHPDGRNLIIQTNHGQVEIIPYSDNILEIKHFDSIPPVKDSSNAVIIEPFITATKIRETSDFLFFSTDSVTALIHKSPFYISFIYHNDTILSEEKGFFKRTDNSGLRFKIGKHEKLFGLGERAVNFSLVGHRYNLYNRPKYGYEYPALNLNYSVPLVVSSKKYMLYFDNPEKGYADIGEAEKSIIEWGAIGGMMKYFVIVGHNYYSIMQHWGKLTGTQPLPPRWALGNLQSRMGYRTQKETDSIVELMQEKDFPIDAIIIDFYWFGDSIKGTMGRLKWYKPNWPQPEQMISNFKNEGIKTILITEPYILDSLKNFKIADELGILAKDSLGHSYVNKGFYFGNGALIDIFKPAAQEWFWKQYQRQIEKGIAGWWGDLGEPENHPSDQIHVNGKADAVHNIYGHYWHKMLFEHYRKYYPEVRLFNLNRAGFAGSQRYSIYPWTGDVSRSWGGLQAQIPTMLHMSLSGLPFIHSDAGGFAQGTKDEELYTRWLQMACLSPILRPHGSVIPSEPVYFSQQTQDIVRHFMRVRYSLLPYIYTTAAQSNLRGYPITRPLFFDFPEDTITYNLGDQYLFGPEMMVAPVIHKGQDSIDIYLPGDYWYNFWDDKKLIGGKWIKMVTDIQSIPVFIKPGSFIPMVKPVNTTDDYSSKEMTIRYYPGKPGDSSTFNVFEDDGKTYGTLSRGEFELLRLKASVSGNGELNLDMIRDGWDYNGRPQIRQIKLEIVGQIDGKEYLFTLNGKKLKKMKKKSRTGYYLNENDRLTIEFPWDGSFTRINVTNKQ